MVDKVQKEVVEQTSPERLRTYLASMDATLKDKVPLFGEKHFFNMSTEEIFGRLSIESAWDFLNYNLLEEVALKFIPQDSVHFSSYAEQLGEFKKKTRLLDFLDVIPCPAKELDSRWDRLKVKIKRHEEISGWTLAKLAEIKGYLSSQFLLREYVLRFDWASAGCIELYWCIPSHLVDHIFNILKERKPDLLHIGVIEVTGSKQSINFQVSYKTY